MKRDARLDIIRIFSLFCVVAVHFLLNCGFYNEIVEGKKMLFMCIYKAFFIICVPMFITLTGYLKNKEKLSKNYFKKIEKILIIYVICSIIYSIFTKYYLKQDMNFSIFIKNLLSYKGTEYSWYIEMYIGLFLLIPFLNLIYNNLNGKQEKRILMIVLFCLIGLNGIVNIFKFGDIEWWKNPSTNGEYVQLIPKWWTSIYPIFYYFLGAYLREFKLKIRNSKLAILIVVSVVLLGFFDYYRSYKSEYIWGAWTEYGSGFVMIITALVFSFLLNINVKENKKKELVLKYMSNACLGAYLISCMFDKIYYKKLEIIVPNVKDRFIYMHIMVLASFASSMILSIIINKVYEYIKSGINNLKVRRSN